jgi:hypothetical protein
VNLGDKVSHISSIEVERESNDKVKHDRWVVSSSTADDSGKQLRDEIEHRARAALEQAANTRCSDDGSSVAAVASEVPAALLQTESDDAKDFMPAVCFLGRKDGYVFKRGDRGLGYYVDKYNCDRDTHDVLDSHSSTQALRMPRADYEFRQTEDAIAVIIQVKNIIDSSVVIRYGEKSVDLKFSACSVADGDSNEHTLGFDMLSEINPCLCKYDVATQNMVVLLHKKAAGIWVPKDDENDVVTLREVADISSMVPLKKFIDIVKSSCEVDDHPCKLDAMKFAAEGLLELD